MQSNPTIPVAVDSDTLLRVIATAADALYVVDRDGFVRFLNPAAAAILGYAEPAELAGRPSHATIHYLRADGSPFPVEECPMLRVRITGQTLHMWEDWFVRKDGSLVPVAYSSAPFRDGDGWGAVVTFRDITERLRLEESTRREAIERAHAEDARRVHVSASPRPPMRPGSRSNATSMTEPSNSSSPSACASKRHGRPLGTTRRSVAVVIETAQSELRVALQELRELARGIHPTVLTGRGLGAALRAMARRSAIPIELDVHLDADRRLPPAVEVCAYFVIARSPRQCPTACRRLARHDPCRGRPGSRLSSRSPTTVSGARRSAPAAA